MGKVVVATDIKSEKVYEITKELRKHIVFGRFDILKRAEAILPELATPELRSAFVRLYRYQPGNTTATSSVQDEQINRAFNSIEKIAGRILQEKLSIVQLEALKQFMDQQWAKLYRGSPRFENTAIDKETEKEIAAAKRFYGIKRGRK